MIDIQEDWSGSNKKDWIRSMQLDLFSSVVQFRGDYKKIYPETYEPDFILSCMGNDDFPDVV